MGSVTLESLRRERDEARAETQEHYESLVNVSDQLTVALAACAEMRAMVARFADWYGTDDNSDDQIREARALLTRTDLGRGWVGPEVVRQCRSVVEAHVRAYPKWTFRGVEQDPDGAHALLADLDALLDDEKGGVK